MKVQKPDAVIPENVMKIRAVDQPTAAWHKDQRSEPQGVQEPELHPNTDELRQTAETVKAKKEKKIYNFLNLKEKIFLATSELTS